MQTNWNTLLIT